MLYLWHPRLPTVLLLLVTSLIFTGLCAADRDGEGVRREETELHRAARQANTVNQLELLIVYDKPVYDKFLARNNNNAALAEAEIDRYFAGIVKEVNERYAKLDSGTGFSLRVILTDVIRNDVTEGLVNNGEVNSDTLLTTFRSTDLESIEPNFPHDLAVLVSGYDLKRTSGPENTDLTFFGAVCGSFKQGVMEDFCAERTAWTMAQMVLHTMRGQHDQVGNSCTDMFYTMRQVFAVPQFASQAGNPFTFSTCTPNEIRNFLTDSRTTCLRNRQTPVGSEVNIPALTTVELGQQYNADTQCIGAFGAGSKFCRESYQSASFDSMCYDMRCRPPGATTCTGTLAFDGTTCGNGKWCQDGLCVSSAQAPNTPTATCPQGDDPTVTCSPSVCSSGNTQLTQYQCCSTCANSATVGPVSIASSSTTQGPTPPVPTGVSLARTTGPTTQPPTVGPTGVSLAGVTTSPPTTVMVSIAGVTTTTAPPTQSPTAPTGLSIAGATTSTSAPKTVSIAGATTSTGTTVAVSIAGETTSSKTSATTTPAPPVSVVGSSTTTLSTTPATTTPAPPVSIAGSSTTTPSGTPATTTPAPPVSIAGSSTTTPPGTPATTTPAPPVSIAGSTTTAPTTPVTTATSPTLSTVVTGTPTTTASSTTATTATTVTLSTVNTATPTTTAPSTTATTTPTTAATLSTVNTGTPTTSASSTPSPTTATTVAGPTLSTVGSTSGTTVTSATTVTLSVATPTTAPSAIGK